MVTTMTIARSKYIVAEWSSRQTGTLYQLAGCLLLCLAGEAYASQWEVTPEIAIAGIYTDNLELQPSGSEQNEFVTQLAPALRAIYGGRHLQSSIDYRMQNLFYSDESDQNETFHQLNAAMQSSLPYNFGIDGNAAVSQQVTNPENGFTFTNIPINSGQTDVFAANINPYWRFANNAGLTTELRYNKGKVSYDDDEVPNFDIPDSELTGVDFTFGNWQNLTAFGWRLMYSREEIEFDLQEADVFEQASLELSSPLSSRALIFLVIGDEENEYEVGPDQEEPTDSFWNVGLRWSSQRGNSFEIFAGERFFGNYYGLSWIVSGNYSSIEISYNEDLSTDTQAQIENQVFAETGFELNTQLRPTTDVFLRKSIESVLRYRRSRVDITVSLRNEMREFQSTGDEDETNSANFSWRWRLGARTNFITSYNYREDLLGVEGQENKSRELRLGLNRSIGPRTLLDVSLRGTDFSASNNSAIDYKENSLTIEFSREF